MWLRSLESFKFGQKYYLYPKKIVSNYLNSWFLIDLLGIFPFEKIFEVLSELAKSYSNYSVCGSTNIHTGKGISYEIRSVIVSVNLSQTCLTLDGLWNPVSHPLWRILFLWNKSIDNCTISKPLMSFYSFEICDLHVDKIYFIRVAARNIIELKTIHTLQEPTYNINWSWQQLFSYIS